MAKIDLAKLVTDFLNTDAQEQMKYILSDMVEKHPFVQEHCKICNVHQMMTTGILDIILDNPLAPFCIQEISENTGLSYDVAGALMIFMAALHAVTIAIEAATEEKDG